MKSGELSTEMPRRGARKGSAAQIRPFASPEVDIYEGPDELLIIVDLPGVSREGLTVSLEGPELTIEGKRASGGYPKGQPVVLEASGDDFQRSFVLPREVDPEGIRAELELGVLRVHLPKSAALKPTSIPLKAR